MKFLLFSKISFEIPDPIALIECYCYQNDFYSKYDFMEDKKIDEIFIDFYKNLQIESNRKNLNYIFDKLLENNIKHLGKIRIFDILWWSYLKAEKLREEKGINWNTIES